MLAIIAAAGCSSDPDTPLGADFIDDGLLGTEPGDVFQDTFVVESGDQSFFIGSRLDQNQIMNLGVKNGYRSSMLLRIDFSDAGEDTNRTVARAFLRLRVSSVSQIDSFTARFYEFLAPYNEGDTLETLSVDSSPIPDSSLVTVDRVMVFAESQYTLPPDLAQRWIRGEEDHNGIAVLYEGSETGKQLAYGSRENGDNSLHPFMTVIFADDAQSNYPVSDDGTFVISERTTSNLIVSDGYIRRTIVPIDISRIDPEVFLHNARLVFTIVPGTDLGISTSQYLLYSPDSSDPADPASRSGVPVKTSLANFVTHQLTFSGSDVIGIFSQYIKGTRDNNGFAIRYVGEGSAVRQLEFYTSASDTLGPRLILTASNPPEFDE
jgi:hypothetical protein